MSDAAHKAELCRTAPSRDHIPDSVLRLPHIRLQVIQNTGSISYAGRNVRLSDPRALGSGLAK